MVVVMVMLCLDNDYFWQDKKNILVANLSLLATSICRLNCDGNGEADEKDDPNIFAEVFVIYFLTGNNVATNVD